MKELGIEEFKSAIDVLVKYGTRAIEFSGICGEPLLWSHFEESVRYAFFKGLKLSLITNGLAIPEISETTLSRFEWIRVSLQSLNHANKIDFKHIPDNVRVSCSYVVANEANLNTVGYLYNFAKNNNMVVRVAVQRPCSEEREEDVKELVDVYGDPLFFSDKEMSSPAICYMAWIRAAIDWNGNFLPCPSVSLNEEYEGFVPKEFILCHISELEKWLNDNPPKDLGYRCKICNCGKENNDFIHELLQGGTDIDFV
jgi:MoaA/NifB/PqqE/SkfB family radical SAM enzyme